MFRKDTNIMKTKKQTTKTDSKKSNYYFLFIDFDNVHSKNEYTNALLSERKEKNKLVFNQDNLMRVFKAIDGEVERLKGTKMKTFISSVVSISESIHNVYIQNEKITYNQFICVFNLLYGLSKCY